MQQKILRINISIIELTRRVVSSSGVSARGLALLLIYYLKLIIVMPGALVQHLFYSRRINKTAITKPPLFIIGHYRSGTTYLHKLLCADKQFGFVTGYDMICPNTSLLFGNSFKNILQVIINRLKIKTAFFNNTIIDLDAPAEEERYLINKASAYADYWKFMFPLQKNIWQTDKLADKRYYNEWEKEYMRLLKMFTYKNNGKQLVLKSPCNTERINYLLKLFPGAKFIYISRNPFDVYYSTVNLWEKAIQKFCLQKISTQQRDEVIFSHHNYFSNQYEKYKTQIPSENFIEVQYEQLTADPIIVLKKIYESLNISGFQSAYENFVRQVKQEKQYIKFKYQYDKITLKNIDKQWMEHVYEWKQTNFENLTVQ